MLYDDKKFVGAKIQEYRRKRKLTQAQLAEKVGLTDKHIGRIESGSFFPACNKFMNILDVLNIDIKEFGVKIPECEDSDKEKIINLIYNISSNEAKFVMPVIESVINCVRQVKNNQAY